MKKLVAFTACGLSVLFASESFAYTWGSNYSGSSGNYRSSYSSGSNGGSAYHSYLNYGRVGNIGGGSVSIPTSTTIHHYDDQGNTRRVQVNVPVVRPPSGNFGKAINRGSHMRRYY